MIIAPFSTLIPVWYREYLKMYGVDTEAALVKMGINPRMALIITADDQKMLDMLINSNYIVGK